MVYMIFDVYIFHDRVLMPLPYTQRRQILEELNLGPELEVAEKERVGLPRA